ncbi:MAG: MXAN_6640 family putative metalloprotease [Pseudomonadota bacterium]
MFAFAVGSLGACADLAELDLRAPRPFEQRVRPTEGGDLFSFDAGATVLSHDSTGGHFKVWYAIDTSDAVPLADADHSGVPDYVELVANRYDDVIAFYVDSLGFRPPVDDTSLGLNNDGGDARFDVYLVDFDHVGDGVFGIDGCVGSSDRCAGYMAMENDFAGYGYPSLSVAVTVLSSHEFFHAIQAAYDSGQDSWWTEATATWAEEHFDPSQEDFEGFLSGYLDNPDRSMDVPPIGSVDSFSYGLAIWAEFLSEAVGPDAVRHIWEDLENGANGVADPQGLATIDATLQRVYSASFASAFTEFAIWNLHTGPFAVAGQHYAEGADYPIVARQWQGALPMTDQLRVYHASTQYLQGRLEGRSQVTAAFVEAAPPELRVGLVLERGSERTDPLWLDDLDAEWPAAADSTGYDSAILVVVNTAIEGSSARPTLCFGSPEEVHLCRFGEGGGGDQPPPGDQPDPGCGCQGAPASAPLLVLGAVLAPVLRRRRS